MKLAKKVLALTLTLVMALSVLTSCGKPSGGNDVVTENEDGTSVIEVSVAIWGAEEGLANPNDPILKALEDATGVRLVPQNITWDDADQKVQLWATNGQLPDIFAGDYIGTTFFSNWVEQGVVKALPDDLSAYPNLSAYLQGTRAQAAKVDGKYYMIPRQTYPDITYSVLDRNIAYRWDLAQAAGVTQEPTNYEEFREMMTKIIAADPEGKNVSGLTQAQPVMLAGGVVLPYAGILDNKWTYKDGEFIPSYFAGDLVTAMQFARDMYQEGTIEKDIALAKVDTAKEKFLQGQNAAILFASGPRWLYTSIAKDYETIYSDRNFLDDVKILSLMPSDDGNKYFFVDTEAWSESYISSKVSDEKLQAICKLFDFLYSEEGKRLVFCGIEGEDYDLVNGEVVMKDGVNLNEKYTFMNPNSSLSSLSMWNPNNVDSNYPNSTPMEYYDLTEARHNDAVKNGTMMKYYQEISFLSTPLKDGFSFSATDDLYQIMMGTEPVEKMVESLIKSYEEKGLREMIAEVNEAAKAAGINP